jgi:hypothetical protein
MVIPEVDVQAAAVSNRATVILKDRVVGEWRLDFPKRRDERDEDSRR